MNSSNFNSSFSLVSENLSNFLKINQQKQENRLSSSITNLSQVVFEKNKLIITSKKRKKNQIMRPSKKQTINALESLFDRLPNVIIKEIFNFIIISEPRKIVLPLVCKKWKKLFNQIHPLQILLKDHACFNKLFLNKPITIYVKNKKFLKKVNEKLGNWIHDQINSCKEKDKDHENFIMENLWLTTFNSHISSPNSRIANLLKFCQKLGIENYNPENHLSLIIDKLIDSKNFSKSNLVEAIRMEFIKPYDRYNNEVTYNTILEIYLQLNMKQNSLIFLQYNMLSQKNIQQYADELLGDAP